MKNIQKIKKIMWYTVQAFILPILLVFVIIATPLGILVSVLMSDQEFFDHSCSLFLILKIVPYEED